MAEEDTARSESVAVLVVFPASLDDLERASLFDTPRHDVTGTVRLPLRMCVQGPLHSFGVLTKTEPQGARIGVSFGRDGERAITLGGGGNATATQKGVFSVPVGTSGGSKALPLTGLVLSGRCESIPPEGGGGTLARPLIETASGATMDAFGSAPPSVVGGTSLLLAPVGVATPNFTNMSSGSVIVTSNGATTTITFGGYIDQPSGSCRFLWQAVEVANS